MSNTAPDAIAEGRFKLLGVIGQGGMATVYRAFDQRLQRPRAIKVLAPALANRPSLRRRFLSEAQTMATLEESRVVRVFDMGEEGELCFIVMELVEGGSLIDRLSAYGPLPPRMAAEVVVQVCESLQAAHDAGVIHRDIKPHNILLTRTGDIRITDFGIAQVQSEDGEGMTRTGAIMGTWGFMAPEQKSNAKTVDARADVYSLGATLWALLRAETPPELFMADHEPEMFADIPEELAEVVRRATRYRREERYLSAQAMAESLRALIALLPPDPELTIPLVPADSERGEAYAAFGEAYAAFAPPEATAVPAFGTNVPADTFGTSVPVDGGTFGRSVPGDGGTAIRAATMAPDTQPARPSGASLHGDRAPSRAWMIPAFGGAVVLGLVAVASILWVTTRPMPVVPEGPPPVAVAAPPVLAPPPGIAPPGIAPPGIAPPVETPPAPGPPVETPPAPGPPVPSNVKPTPPIAVIAPVVAPPAVLTPAVTPAVTPPPATPPEATPVAAGASLLTVSPSTPATLGQNATFSASIAGDWKVRLYYRVPGQPFQNKAMSGSGGRYTTSVRITETMKFGLEYFVAAEHGDTTLREPAPTRPLKLVVAEPAAPEPAAPEPAPP